MAEKEQLINQITGLDFEEIKTNLKNFLRTQDRFKDYDFEGSNLSVLIDLLGYNTHYIAFYLNMIASEMYLTSATKRGSAVNIAKQLGYVPRSVRSAKSSVNISKTSVSIGDVLIIPNNTKFTVDILGTKYTFNTTKEYRSAAATAAGQELIIRDIELVEGRQITQRYTISSANITGVEIQNSSIDTSQIQVFVRSGLNTSDDLVYTLADTVVGIDETSLVYFVEEIENQRYKIGFGDGVLGKALVSGNVVTVKYLISSGVLANGANEFALTTPVLVENNGFVSSDNVVTIEVNSVASGGDSIESIDSIKLQAPLLYQTQRRAVTAQDYAEIIKSVFGDIDSVTAWGGEDNDPVLLGYVFISAKPESGLFLTDSKKIEIETELRKNYCPLTISPVMVDPEFVFIKPIVVVKYDEALNANGPGAVRTAVTDAIYNYGQSDLERFGEYFRYSKLSRVIDRAESSITNSITTLRIERRIEISNQNPGTYTFNFYNTLEQETVESSFFPFTDPFDSTAYPFVYIRETDELDGTGNNYLGIFTKGSNNEDIALTRFQKIGIVHVDRKKVTLFEEDVSSLLNWIPTQTNPLFAFETIKFSGEPVSFDIFPIRNVLLTIDSGDITVSAVPDTRPD